MFKEGYYEKLGYDLYYKLEDYRTKYSSLASISQISLLMGLISKHRFKNGKKIERVLEIGIYNGVTSLYMLKAGCESSKNYKQYAIDIETSDFFGEAVIKEASKEELKSFHLNRGKTALNIPEILDRTEKLDLVFIDGGHSHPHPLIDLINVIPYLHEESIICLHDVVDYMRPNAWGESFIYEIWPEKKYRNTNEAGKKENLGIIKLPENKEILFQTLLNIAKIPFRAAPWEFDEKYLGIRETDIKLLEKTMINNYNSSFVKEFIGYLDKNLKIYEEEYIYRIHETRFFNYLFEKITKLQHEVVNLKSQLSMISRNNNNSSSSNILKILHDNKDKNILFWGASLYLENFIKENNLSDYNIIGIIDKHAKHKCKLMNYRLYAPEEIKELNADLIISTVFNSNKEVHQEIKHYLTQNEIHIDLAPNIFI